MARIGFTVFPALSSSDLPPGWRRAVVLCLESAAYTGVSLAITGTLGVGPRGLISVFLASAALATRFDELLHENRCNVWERRLTSWQANRLTAASVLAMFLGVLLAYVGAALWLGEARLREPFDFALRAAAVGDDTLFTRRFQDLGSILRHNGLVMVAFAILGWFYRSYGALLALCWNACVWGVALTVLLRRGAADPWLLFAAALALVPHVVLEASAQVTISLAAIFASRGLFRYGPRDARLRRVLRASAVLALVAGLLLLLAGVAEAYATPLLLRLAAARTPSGASSGLAAVRHVPT